MKNWKLMLAPLGITIFGMTVLWLKQSSLAKTGADVLPGPLNYLPWLVLVSILALFVQQVIIKLRLDTFIFPLALTLASIGLIEIARLKPALFIRQLQWLGVGMLVLIIVLRFWKKIVKLMIQ